MTGANDVETAGVVRSSPFAYVLAGRLAPFAVAIGLLVWVLVEVPLASQPPLLVAIVRNGCFVGLIALGYALILEATGFFNFALGANTMFGALMCAYLTTHGYPVGVAIVISVAASAVAGILTDVAVIGPIERRGSGDELPALVAVTAVLFLLQQLGGWLFGRAPLPGENWVSDGSVHWGRFTIPIQTIVMVIVTTVIFAAIGAWMRMSERGALLRAVGSSPEAARVLGLPVTQLRFIAFGGAGAIAAIAGSLFAATSGVQTDNGFVWSLYGFLALVIGGRAPILGPLSGGFTLAAVQVYAGYVLGGGALQYATLALGLVFFIFKPQGLVTRRLRT